MAAHSERSLKTVFRTVCKMKLPLICPECFAFARRKTPFKSAGLLLAFIAWQNKSPSLLLEISLRNVPYYSSFE